MPDSAPVTRQFLKDELFKQSTLFVEAMNQLIERFDKRFEQIDDRFDQVDLRFEKVDGRFDGLDKIFVTKGEWADQMDQIMGELKHIREDQQANYNIDMRQNKRLDTVETHLNLAAA